MQHGPRLNWWRRALVRFGQALIRWANPPTVHYKLTGQCSNRALERIRLTPPRKAG